MFKEMNTTTLPKITGSNLDEVISKCNKSISDTRRSGDYKLDVIKMKDGADGVQLTVKAGNKTATIYTESTIERDPSVKYSFEPGKWCQFEIDLGNNIDGIKNVVTVKEEYKNFNEITVYTISSPEIKEPYVIIEK